MYVYVYTYVYSTFVVYKYRYCTFVRKKYTTEVRKYFRTFVLSKVLITKVLPEVLPYFRTTIDTVRVYV